MGHWKKGFRTLIVLGLTLGLLGPTRVALAADETAKDAASGVMAPPAPAQTAEAGTPAPPKPDPRGSATGGIGDITAKVPGKPTLEEVAETAGHNKISINIVWTLITGYLVMFMSMAGFGLVEIGFTRAKNAAHTMMMVFLIYATGMIGYWIMGFALQMGGVGGSPLGGGTVNLDGEFTITLFGKPFGLWGTKGFFMSGVGYDVASSLSSSSRWCSWTRRSRSQLGRWRNGGNSPRS
jgi:hypothetical protein